MKKFVALLLTAISLATLASVHETRAQSQAFFHALLRSQHSLRAGPGTNYPKVTTMYPNRYFELYACLRDWSWCDVASGRARGWLRASDIYITETTTANIDGARAGVPITGFVQKDYWYTYYRDQVFYENWLNSGIETLPPPNVGYYPSPLPYPPQKTVPPLVSPEPSPVKQNDFTTLIQEHQQHIREGLNDRAHLN